MKLLIVCDNQELIREITLCLQVRWPRCTVVSVGTVGKGIDMLRKEAPDLAILDMSLPDIDGLKALAEIRSFSHVPVIIIANEGNQMQMVWGLEMGADDYITEPFSPIELLARANALLRRIRGDGFNAGQDSLITCGSLTLNLTTREAFVSGSQVRLTPIEHSLLSHLVRNQGRVVSRFALLEGVWGREYVDDHGFLKKYVYRLRQKLGDSGRNPRMIVNERGVGYRLVESA